MKGHRFIFVLAVFGVLFALPSLVVSAEEEMRTIQRPRLYFDRQELAQLRAQRAEGVRAQIWENIVGWAEWATKQPLRDQWIPTRAEDPQYENLYDRFYAAMHDMAIVEHLALTSALSDPHDESFFDAARDWTLAAARIWRNEAENSPDAGKAYAVLRVMKALAVAYDVLYDRLTLDERAEVRQTLLEVGDAYYQFFQDPLTAGAGYNKHHGSVDAAPFGVMALSLMGEAPEVQDWLDLAIKKHVDYLLPEALTPSGTSDQSSNFWASTLQYRVFFLDPLRRVTGRDLFGEFPDSLPGNIALAAVAGRQPRNLTYNEDNRSVLFGPSYGQINYWSPVLLYLARHHRQPLYQRLALWDESLGSLQRTRYITPTRHEELLFSFGPYAYLWYDPTVSTDIPGDAVLSYEFPEPEVNETYLRDSYDSGDIVVGMKKGGLIVHAGGRPVLVDLLDVADINNPAPNLPETILHDDGQIATIRCEGPASAGLGEQLVQLRRPGQLTIRREASEPLSWWYAGEAQRNGNAWTWPDNTRLEVAHGEVVGTDPEGHVETKVHYGGMKFADPHPFRYPTVTVAPADGVVELRVNCEE